MDANRFFSVPYDNRNDITIRRMKKKMGGVAAYGRWVSLLGMLYDSGGILDLNDATVREIVAEELEITDVDQYFLDLIELGLIEREPYVHFTHVVNDGVCDELEYRRVKREAGVKSGEARRKAKQQREQSERTEQ